MKLNAREAARLLAMPERELYAMVDAGSVPCHLVNKQPLFSDVELLEWATAEGRPLAEALPGEPHALADAIGRGGIHHDVPGHDVPSILSAVVERIPIDDAREREVVLAVLRARPVAVTTSIGDGIAIPHVRTPLVFGGRAPAIVICYLAGSFVIEPSEQPIQTIFAMTTPTVGVHLQMLSRLAIALHDPGFRGTILRRASRDDVIAAAARLEPEPAP